jgi:hypothetical protein
VGSANSLSAFCMVGSAGVVLEVDGAARAVRQMLPTTPSTR